MMKILPVLFVALSVTACQANTTAQPAPAVQPVAAPAPEPVAVEKPQDAQATDMQQCYSQINELKRFDRKQYNNLHAMLTKVVREQASLNASQQYASSETMNYIRYQQNKSISMICSQASQKLDKLMVKKALASSY